MKPSLLLAAILAACATAAVSAAVATAAMLKVAVTPAIVHRSQTYAVTITGRYHRRGYHGTPHLLAFIQYAGALCQPTATAEYDLPVSEWSWLFYRPYGLAITHRRFTHVFYEQAQTRFGDRRICAYLYGTSVMPQTTAKPVVRAGAPFEEAYKPGG